MPIYDFHCRTCGHEFAALVGGADTAECPSCHGRDLKRLLSGFAVSTQERTQAAAKASRAEGDRRAMRRADRRGIRAATPR